MSDSETFEYKSDLDGTALRIGIVVGRFNQDISDGLLSACTAELAKLGVANGDIEVVTVPGDWRFRSPCRNSRVRGGSMRW